jgi:hypothetical protein
MLALLSEWWYERGRGDLEKLIVHADNARPLKTTRPQQFMAQKAIVVVNDHPYSQDLAPFDFSVFGHVKDLLRAESSETEEQLLSAVEGILLPSTSRL